jgi:dihydroorotase
MTCEVSPHHLFFDMENRDQFLRGEWLQMIPPLRRPEDREALREAFEAGDIEALATDHAPHSLEENRRGISGVPHLDTFGAFVTWLHADGMPWKTLIERASTTPARLFAPFAPLASAPRGEIAPGQLASLAVVDPSAPWRVEAGSLSTRAAWSPFEGVELPGRVVATVVRGRAYEMK